MKGYLILWLRRVIKFITFKTLSNCHRHFRMKRTILLLTSLLILFFSCRKEIGKPSWDTEILAPIVNASLNINNILPDSVLQSNVDSSMKIVYEGDIYKLSMDTLFNIPDTTIKNNFNIPFAYTFNPGQVVINNSVSETTYSLGTAQLRTVTIKKGSVRYTVKSKIHEVTDFVYAIPGAKLNGIPFSINVSVPAAIGSTPGIYNKVFDLSGYQIDLTGISHNKVNTIYTSLRASVSATGNPVNVAPTDSLIIENTFYDMFPYYAKGYFGNNTFDIGPASTDFTMFNRILSGSIQLEDVNFKLSLENPIGMDARVYINNLSSINSRTGISINLANSIVGSPININRAAESGSTVYPTYANFPLTIANSNIKPMIENLPDKFGYTMKIITNPMGNISGSNDFIYSDQLLKAKINMEIPLSLIATNLVLSDTLNLNIQGSTESQNIHSGTITLLANNGFPLDASVQLYFLNAQNVITDSLYDHTNTIDEALINSSLRVIAKKPTKLVSPVSESKMKVLYASKRAILKIKFNTSSQSQYIKIYSDYSIDVKLIGDVNYTIQYQ